MPYCTNCGAETARTYRFCLECGTPTAGAEAQAGPSRDAPSEPRISVPRHRGIGCLVPIMGVGFLVMIISVLGKGCASASGTFEASGANPLGTALFNPTECASGQAQGFFGVSLLQDSPSAGSIVVIKDVVRGRLVQVNIPGHCAPPNVGQCRPVELSADMCRLFDVRIESTNLQVNDIRALEGHLNLDCPFPDGGLIKSDITFTGCH